MGMSDLTRKYQLLRIQLEAAYSAPVWNSRQIDSIADEMVKTECALARSARESTFAIKHSACRSGDVMIG